MRYWRELRAGLIALAIGLGLLDGCPVPREPSERAIARARLGPDLYGAVERLDRVRRRILRPVRPVSDLLGLRQRWKLFAGANHLRYRMAIEVRDDGDPAWHLVYRAHDDDHAFLAEAIEYRRMRASWNPHTTYGAPGAYHAFVGWIADEIFARDPRAAEVRVQMERIVIGRHGDFRGTGEYVDPMMVRRAARDAVRGGP